MKKNNSIWVNICMVGAASLVILAVMILAGGNEDSRINAAGVCGVGSFVLTLVALHKASEK